jgi:hypothetical protein
VSDGASALCHRTFETDSVGRQCGYGSLDLVQGFWQQLDSNLNDGIFPITWCEGANCFTSNAQQTPAAAGVATLATAGSGPPVTVTLTQTIYRTATTRASAPLFALEMRELTRWRRAVSPTSSQTFTTTVTPIVYVRCTCEALGSLPANLALPKTAARTLIVSRRSRTRP